MMCDYHIFVFLILKFLTYSAIDLIQNGSEPCEIYLAIIAIAKTAFTGHAWTWFVELVLEWAWQWYAHLLSRPLLSRVRDLPSVANFNWRAPRWGRYYPLTTLPDNLVGLTSRTPDLHSPVQIFHPILQHSQTKNSPHSLRLFYSSSFRSQYRSSHPLRSTIPFVS
jgi:hypothetical protein